MWNGSFDVRFTNWYFGINFTDELFADIMLMKHTVEEEAVSMFEKHTTSKEFDQKTIILQCAKCGEVKTKKIEL